MAAHRYWRILVNSTQDGSNPAFFEIEMAETVGGADQCTGGTPTSSGFTTGRGASNAFDGNTTGTSYWNCNTANTGWIRYDFGAGNEKDIAEVRIFPYSTAGTRPSSMTIQWSDDGSAWTDVNTYTDFNWSSNFDEFPKRIPVSGHRFWRVNVSAVPGGADQVSVKEIEMADAPAGADLCTSGFASSSSSAAGRPSSNAFDNSLGATDFWRSNGNAPQWIMYDFLLGNYPEIVELRMAAESDANERPTNFTIEYSDDLITWTVVRTETGYTFASADTFYAFELSENPPSTGIRATQIPLIVSSVDSQQINVSQIPLLVIQNSEQPSKVTQIPVLPLWEADPIPAPLPVIPEVPVLETWEWFTVISAAEKSREQRSALRSNPRVNMSFTGLILNDLDWQEVFQMLFSYVGRTFLYPMYQHTAQLTSSASSGSNELLFDLSATDVRAGEYIALFSPQDHNPVFLEIQSLIPGGVELVENLSFDVPAYYMVCPAVEFRTNTSVSTNMVNLSGNFTLDLKGVKPRQIKKTDDATSLTYLEDVLLIEPRPLADDPMSDELDQNVFWIDNGIYQPEPVVDWPIPFLSGPRRFLVHRPQGMEYWRAVGEYLRGRQNPFLIPTYRDDLPLLESPDLGATVLLSSNKQYAVFWRNDAYRWIRIVSDSGVIYRKILEATSIYNNSGNPIGSRLQLNSSIGASAGSNIIQEVSYVNLARLDTDEINIEHGSVDSVVTLMIRAVNQ